MIRENYEEVCANIRKACERAGRDPKEVTLVCVSKTHPAAEVQECYDAGARIFGENKVQEMTGKMDELPDDIQWHMIGHLQRNKVKYIVGRVALIHSVDSYRLAEEINIQAKKKGIRVPVLIEVNYAGEETKFGVRPEDTEQLIRDIAERLDGIEVQGLMTSAPFTADPEEVRPVFRGMKELLVDINSKKIDNISMKTLSMGMTNDYIQAVEEGSTMVRVGTAIFGARNYRA